MGDWIIRLLEQENPRFDVFRACVAYVKSGGMLRLVPSLAAFLDRGGRVEFVAGLDDGITTRQGLELIRQYSTVAHVFCNPVSTFHPKIYLFEKLSCCAVCFVGSSNLTSGGLYTNYEANLGLALDLMVPTDQQIYQQILSIYLMSSDMRTGNAKLLDDSLLADLVAARVVSDETHLTRRNRLSVYPGSAVPGLFPRTPIPAAPRIASQLRPHVPAERAASDSEASDQPLADVHSWQLFVMILGGRDTRQQTGFSRDVFIPLAARDFDADFWGWPSKFSLGQASTAGKYLERRLNMLVRPAAGQSQVVEGVRLYYYDRRHEFRLNCGRLIDGARPGDLLVIQRSPSGVMVQDVSHEYEATVISTSHPEYAPLNTECRNQVAGSSKRWGYA